MNKFFLVASMIMASQIARADLYLGDVRLPGSDEINLHSKVEQVLDVRSCRNGFRVSEIQLETQHGVSIDNVTVVFANGNEDDIHVRRNIRAHRTTQWKDVTGPKGRSRCVRSIVIEGTSQDDIAGALVGVNAEINYEDDDDFSDFVPGSVTFYKSNFSCLAIGSKGRDYMHVPYSSNSVRQSRLCEKAGQNKKVRYAKIQGKCVRIGKERFYSACERVMADQESYYNETNPILDILGNL